jgi:hypothetical protein
MSTLNIVMTCCLWMVTQKAGVLYPAYIRDGTDITIIVFSFKEFGPGLNTVLIESLELVMTLLWYSQIDPHKRNLINIFIIEELW